MKQIFHIFQKDVRHFWGEIAISLALLAVFAWTGPSHWREALIERQRPLYAPVGLSIEVLLLLLIPLSWWLLITRVVHEERLVGDRQFWITRPYEWPKLLASKALLVVCFVYLPLAATQWWLLAVAGLHPACHIGALLYDWMLLTALPILPIAALAAVTRNIARMVLTLLGFFVAVAAIGALIVALLQNGAMHSPVERNNPFYVPILLAACAVVIGLAYRTRKIVVGRVILLALPGLLILSSVLFSSDATINRHYPEIGTASIQFSLKDNARALETAHVAISSRQLYIQIPLSASGIAPGDLWVGKGVRITLETGGQILWASPWQELSFFLPTNGNTFLGFNVDRAVFDRVQREPVTLRLEIALDQARREQVEASQVSLHDVEIPGLGNCSSIIDPRWPELINGKPTPAIEGLTCRSALRDPRLTLVEAAFTRGPCQSAPGNDPSPLEVQDTWIGNLNSEPAELGIAPVKVVPLPFSGNWVYNSPDKFSRLKHLCPGAPVMFTRYGLVRHLRTELTLDNFQFPSYDKREDAAQ
jgi:hypothetical protein